MVYIVHACRDCCSSSLVSGEGGNWPSYQCMALFGRCLGWFPSGSLFSSSSTLTLVVGCPWPVDSSCSCSCGAPPALYSWTALQSIATGSRAVSWALSLTFYRCLHLWEKILPAGVTNILRSGFIFLEVCDEAWRGRREGPRPHKPSSSFVFACVKVLS